MWKDTSHSISTADEKVSGIPMVCSNWNQIPFNIMSHCSSVLSWQGWSFIFLLGWLGFKACYAPKSQKIIYWLKAFSNIPECSNIDLNLAAFAIYWYCITSRGMVLGNRYSNVCLFWHLHLQNLSNIVVYIYKTSTHTHDHINWLSIKDQSQYLFHHASSFPFSAS